MQGENAAERGDFLHSQKQRPVIHLPETPFPFAAGIGDKSLKPGHSSRRQPFKLCQIPRNKTAPQHIIHR
ncbi:hypothetical protein D3C75_1247150 [compost metagenome]